QLVPHPSVFGLGHLGNMTGRVAPDPQQPTFLARPTVHQRLQELHRQRAVTPTLFPQEALPVAEVISPVAVKPLRQLRAVALAPDPLADTTPGVTQIQVAVEV